MSYRWSWIPLSLIVLSLFGCGDGTSVNVVQETEEKHYQRAQRLLREGREDEALNSFLKVIDRRSDAAESHLEAGRLYQKHIGDPVTAIYHYQRFIVLKPESDEADRVKQLIDSAKKDFAKTLSGQPFRNDIDRLDLLEILEGVRAENLELKQQLANAQTRLSQYGAVAITPPSGPRQSSQSSGISNPPGGQQQSRSNTTTTAETTPGSTYTVVTGDTLSRISTKVYGQPIRWREIFEANRDILPNPDALKVGQVLKIPAE
ncbi:LysM peptidoglycan-binding domain-containing protein [Rubellicoccus peritrichatus]|uniref:LysM peptidoglycan-binding domain-containing protein n=1 Tax=Rubellicoccus peritrichatus TaxID=3080537 RepID=A0AAQ3QTN3_9BACT|nr:LysM peptidoglycan-binding domain-containing protein [Puniceicoccus sp. CR14]WOO39573.1 LysM peptidoglycan-binding domain-containing protein [Puniceicoccus sp. CR14]